MKKRVLTLTVSFIKQKCIKCISKLFIYISGSSSTLFFQAIVCILCASSIQTLSTCARVNYSLGTEGGLFGKAGARFDTCAADICSSSSQLGAGGDQAMDPLRALLRCACEPPALRSFTTEVRRSYISLKPCCFSLRQT